MTKPLIALLTNNDDDVYCFRRELILKLIENGYDVLVSCPDGPKLSLMKDIPFIYDNPDIDRRGMNPFSDLKLYFHYRSILKKYNPAVVLTYTAKPNVYAGVAAYRLNIPAVYNVTGLGSVQNMGAAGKHLILSLYKFAYRRASCIMFQNEANMNFALKSGWVKGEYNLICGSGVNTGRFKLQDYPEGGNGVTGSKVVFNYIGRVLHDKGIDDYIEAAGRIRKEYPNTEFNIIGFIEPTEMYYEDELKMLGKDGIVKYMGSQQDVRPFIAASHALIHPSTYGEGMSNVLLENASCGRPAITTDNPGCRETVDDNITGYIYHGGNVDELTDKIKQFLALDNEERKQMGIYGRKKVKKEFERQNVIRAYLDVVNARSR